MALPQMPVLDGLAATRALRALEKSSGKGRLRIVGCTGAFSFFPPAGRRLMEMLRRERSRWAGSAGVGGGDGCSRYEALSVRPSLSLLARSELTSFAGLRSSSSNSYRHLAPAIFDSFWVHRARPCCCLTRFPTRLKANLSPNEDESPSNQCPLRSITCAGDTCRTWEERSTRPKPKV